MKKINIHYSTLIFFLLYILSGMFKNVIILFSIIFIHEMGHLITSIILKYDIKKINFYPYGGLIEYYSDINTPIVKDFLVSISGVMFQSIYYFIILIMYNKYMIRESSFIIFCNYHFSILIFNLIPIYPLDGARILNLIINKFCPFKMSHIISIIISIVAILIIIINNLTVNMILISMLLIQKIVYEIKYHKYIFNRFLLERHIKKYDFINIKKIYGYSFFKMYRDYKHEFIVNNRSVDEKNALNLRFKIDI